MARQLEWTRYSYLGIQDSGAHNGTHTIQTYVAGATITRIRFTPFFTGGENASFGSLGAFVGFGIYAVPQSQAAGYLPFDNVTEADWLWWECIPLDGARIPSTTDPATLPAWTSNANSAQERDCKAQRVSPSEPQLLIWSWQLRPGLENQMAVWGGLGASIGVLAPA